MKLIKFAMVIIFLFVMMGCGGTGDWRQHDTMYKNWDHLKFSWTGYTSPTMKDVEKSSSQNWWGEEIPAENVK